MQIGDFRYKLQVLNRTDTTDSYGEKVSVYSPRTTVWAARGDITMKYSAKDAIGTDTLVFTIRYLKDFNSDLHVNYQGKEYRIDNIMVKGRDEFLVLTISRVDNLV